MNNKKIYTHVFFHRTHIDIFNYVFPPGFRNWYSDDWITSIYGRYATNKDLDVMIVHDKEFRKREHVQRYKIDYEGEQLLQAEIHQPKIKINNLMARICRCRNVSNDANIPATLGFWEIPARLSDKQQEQIRKKLLHKQK